MPEIRPRRGRERPRRGRPPPGRSQPGHSHRPAPGAGGAAREAPAAGPLTARTQPTTVASVAAVKIRVQMRPTIGSFFDGLAKDQAFHGRAIAGSDAVGWGSDSDGAWPPDLGGCLGRGPGAYGRTADAS